MTLILTRGEIVTCKVLGLGSDGEGIADHLGMKIFVEGAIPGEVIKLRITQVKKNYAHGVLITVVTPSEHRTRAPCPYFDRCGGCQIQHLTHSFQLEMKRNRVVEALRRIGKIENVEVLPCVPSEKNFGYRNKIQFPVSKEKKLGLYQKGSHEIVPVDAM
jgi:23S rRNA (uracil1939-C5)-methyltransferase